MDRSRKLKNLNLQILSGPQAQDHFDPLAALRIEIFQDYPYLYQGSLDYEKKYLTRYLKEPHAIFVLVWDQKNLVGAATGMPLINEEDFVQKPFLKQNFNLSEYFYFGESLLKAAYRGRGLGHVFFDEREKWAHNLGYKKTCFCAVQRPSDHPMRPKNYRPQDEFWIKRGYAPSKGLVGQFSWQDLDQKLETDKPMQFWMSSQESKQIKSEE
ncbi:MAG: GNAT family N-acetyltransferase [Bdellovibrionales bacterium]